MNMKNKTFMVPAQMTRCSSLRDGGLNVGFHTKEITPKEKAEIMEFDNQIGFLVFAENEVEEEDIPKDDAEFEQKTPSQRLRATLFVYWKQLGEPGNFQSFYVDQVEKVINVIKSKLE
jgi:cobalamin biosynthesis Co2+ chelatase CbiK